MPGCGCHINFAAPLKKNSKTLFPMTTITLNPQMCYQFKSVFFIEIAKSEYKISAVSKCSLSKCTIHDKKMADAVCLQKRESRVLAYALMCLDKCYRSDVHCGKNYPCSICTGDTDWCLRRETDFHRQHFILTFFLFSPQESSLDAWWKVNIR